MNSILVALSGGVDSGVCALMLKNKGYRVGGIYMIMSKQHENGIEKAEKAAKQLGIPLYTVDARKEFGETIISYFINEYAEGRTPNPCVRCNPAIKFRQLLACADQNGYQYIATGHYARTQDGLIRKAVCEKRDQSYMLYRLEDDAVNRLLMPLGDVHDKGEVRKIAKENGLDCHDAPDSSENCFLPDADYAAFLREKLGILPGDLVSPDGHVCGRHEGIYNFTIGQRKGVGAFGKPVFVKRIEHETRRVFLAWGGDEYSDTAVLSDCIWHRIPEGEKVYGVKIRSAARAVGAKIEGDRVLFEQPARAVAPGQSAVVYEGELVIGGGVILK
ncbi:MAG TPA: tRNA 2-thiouridine(34) synthase MnmA [Oscillospiraceae bacterium]|nr:tRNA 2-thiouridine(34) synthase MnmA [Oscillospiraceae bacterium]HPS33766.1 tRNA 2-thiouridine(34) synthase MnmA [Oscillospiraceae bacterium]